MSHWVWLSRITLLGLVGTAALASLFFPKLGLNQTSGKRNSDRLLATAIAPEEIQALNLSASPSPPPTNSPLPTPTTALPPPPTTALPPTPKTSSAPTAKTSSAPTAKKSSPPTPKTSSAPTAKTSSPSTTKKSSAPTAKTRSYGSLKLVGNTTVQNPPFDLKKSLITYSPLFATPTSLGMVAIGVAEGNYQLIFKDSILYVQQTPNYFGHTDPGNLSWGQVVSNYGPCSDQGRSGGNIALAEQMCLQRSLAQLPTNLADLNAAGINPNLNLEAVLNTADLYNQASPIHSRHFPKALAMAQRGGLRGIEAFAWARTASFYLNLNNELDIERGLNQATGLIGICARENRPITEWQCVYNDQLRRVKAIASVLEKYRQKAQRLK